MNDEGFEKLNEAFNTSFSDSVTGMDDVEKQIEVFEEQKNKLIAKKDNELATIEDKEYIQKEIKIIVENGKLVLEKVAKDIKIGANPRQIEVYAKLMDSVINGLSQLRELNRIVSDKEFMMGNFNNNEEKVNVNIKMSGKDLLNMINDAKENSQLNAIDTDFEIEEIKE